MLKNEIITSQALVDHATNTPGELMLWDVVGASQEFKSEWRKTKHNGLTKRQRLTLEFIKFRGNAIGSEITKNFGISDSNITGMVAPLIKKGLIEKDEITKSFYLKGKRPKIMKHIPVRYHLIDKIRELGKFKVGELKSTYDNPSQYLNMFMRQGIVRKTDINFEWEYLGD